MDTDNSNPRAARARSVAGGRGVAWIGEGWELFVKQPGMWILLTLVVMVISIASNLIPLVAPFVTTLLLAGMLLAGRKQQDGANLQVSDLFAVLSHRALAPLLIVTLIYVALIVAAAFVIFAAFGFGGGALALLGNALSGEETALALGFGTLLLALLAFLTVLIPVIAMYWFAVPLVVFRATEPWAAMKASLDAVLANLVPLLLYGAVAMLVFLVACIPLMLGLIVAAPVLTLSWLVSYQDLFEAGA